MGWDRVGVEMLVEAVVQTANQYFRYLYHEHQ